MVWINKHLARCAMAALAIHLGSSDTAIAAGTTYHCKGVNYLYESGIGAVGGKARRVTATRTLLLDLDALTAELKDGDAVSKAALEMKFGVYQGFIPGKTQAFGAAVRGVVLEFHPKFRSLELKYELENERHFLSFTGRCHQ